MAFIPIDAKADVKGSKKGKLTPAQHAQLNAWCLSNKTGILDFPQDHSKAGRCEATALQITNIQNYQTEIVFNKGYLVICGRLVECEENTKFTFRTPTTGTEKGKIVAKFSLGSDENEEFKIIQKTGALIQNDLNDNPVNGEYEFELYSYTATPTSVTLERRNIDYVKSVEQRLDELGFNEGVAEYSGFNTTPYSNSLKKQGKYVIFNFSASGHVLSANATAKIVIPKEFLPKQNISFIAGFMTFNLALSTTFYSMSTLTLNAETGEITIKAGVNDVMNIYIYNIGWETE